MIAETVPRRAMEDIGVALDLMDGHTLVLDSEVTVDIFTDSCIYDWVEDGANVVQRYAADRLPPADTDEREMLDAMTRARYTILSVGKQVPRKGIHARDLRTGKDVFVIDMNLSLSDRWSGGCLAARLLPLGRFWMTSGTALPVAPALAEAFLPGGVLNNSPYEEEARAFLDVPEIILGFVGCAIATGSTGRVAYSEDLEPTGRSVPQTALAQHRQTAELAPPRRPSRNAPCPCGSGRQYKRCCGRERRARRTA
jgi:hypothetical protein